MRVALLIFLLCQFAGEVLYQVFRVPIPGPVTGMLILTFVLLRKRAAVPESIEATGRVLLQNLGLFFVPAGVGIIANFDLIRKEWVPICVALAGSTCLSLMATAWVVHRLHVWLQSRAQAGSAPTN